MRRWIPITRIPTRRLPRKRSKLPSSRVKTGTGIQSFPSRSHASLSHPRSSAPPDGIRDLAIRLPQYFCSHTQLFRSYPRASASASSCQPQCSRGRRIAERSRLRHLCVDGLQLVAEREGRDALLLFGRMSGSIQVGQALACQPRVGRRKAPLQPRSSKFRGGWQAEAPALQQDQALAYPARDGLSARAGVQLA